LSHQRCFRHAAPPPHVALQYWLATPPPQPPPRRDMDKKRESKDLPLIEVRGHQLRGSSTNITVDRDLFETVNLFRKPNREYKELSNHLPALKWLNAR
jgi:hypothetical protein